MPTNTWYALYTKSRAEKKVAQELTKMGVTNYLPLKRELKHWSDRKKWVETPAISSYIFIKIEKEHYKDVFRINGIVSYVSYKGQPLTIPEHEIMAMKKAIEGNINFDVQARTITEGEQVTVTSGPLLGVSGIVKSVQSNKKLFLNITNLGYTLVVDLNESMIKVE